MTSTTPYHVPTNSSEASLRAPTLPPYSEHATGAGDHDIELTNLRPSSASSSSSSSTSSTSAATFSPPNPGTTFTPTQQLQIQTPGKRGFSLPTSQRPDPTPIFSLTPEGHLDRPLYLSIRPSARSGSCFLVHGDDASEAPLSTTRYRFGPGRPPVIVLGDPARDPAISPQEPGEAQGQGQGQQGFEVLGRRLFSRAVRFEVPGLGSFAWRYASSKERASAGADSLLVCEVLVPAPDTPTSTSSNPLPQRQSLSTKLGLAGGEAKTREKEATTARRIAQLVRNAAYRSPGSRRASAGNGGRLMLDLRAFDEKSRERVQWLVVTTALTMLKREVDRRRGQQAAAIGAGAAVC
ncbi:hypothetical protein F5Y19DRAFT_200584 [Xylariaceae sp. FL1651]|nr:hypothetical protein F5Y19DRAFT_200584 [Xylariaceae sp. FL1651]